MTMQMSAVGRSTISVSVTKALTAAGNYSGEDVLSESATDTVGTAWTFANVVVNNGGRGYIVKAQALCETTALIHSITLYLFNATPTSELDDNAANTAVIHADVAKYLGRIDFPALSELGGDSEAVATPSTYGNLPMEIQCAATSTTIYGIAVTRDAITGETAGDDLTFKLTVES